MDVVIDKCDVQLVEKVRIKRNRGLKADVLKQIAINKDVSPNEVFEALKSNVYGGSKPVSLGCVMSTMSQIKGKKFNSPDLKNVNLDNSKSEPKSSNGQDTSQREPKEQ